MKIDALIAFATVVEKHTFTAAAVALRRSQPALSKLVAQLEHELGFMLFDRSAYRPVLTQQGRAFYERAVPLIEQTAALIRFGASLAGHTELAVRLAVDAIVPLRPVTQVLRRIEAEAPHIRFELQTVALGEAIKALQDDRADLALGHHQSGDLGPTLTQLHRHSEVEIVAVVQRDHPLAQQPFPTPAALLRVYPQIILRDRSTTSRTLNVLRGGRHWSVTDVHAKKHLIVDGMGWGGLPRHVVADEIASGQLVSLHVHEFDTPALQLYLGRRPHAAHGPVAHKLWEALHEARSHH